MPVAVQYNSFGPVDVLDLVEVPEVHPSPGKVRLSVRAAGLNPFDAKMRAGLVPLGEVTFPRGIGGDVAGVVDEVGEDSMYYDGTPISVGDEVLGWVGNGAMREQLIVPAASIVPKPAALDWAVAGSLSTASHAAQLCIEVLDIGPSDTVLLSAAAGSVGIVYAQLAIARGASIIGTASERNHALLESIGVVPTTYGPGLVERVRALGPSGVTAVQDNAGRETIDAGFELGLPASRICTIVDYAAVSELGIAAPPRTAKSAQELAHIAGLAAEGRLQVPIAATFPLADVREAFQLIESRHDGKIVLTTGAI